MIVTAAVWKPSNALVGGVGTACVLTYQVAEPELRGGNSRWWCRDLTAVGLSMKQLVIACLFMLVYVSMCEYRSACEIHRLCTICCMCYPNQRILYDTGTVKPVCVCTHSNFKVYRLRFVVVFFSGFNELSGCGYHCFSTGAI